MQYLKPDSGNDASLLSENRKMLGRAHFWSKHLQFTAAFTISSQKNEPQNKNLVMGHFQQIFLNSKAQCGKQVSDSTWCFPALAFPSFTSKGMLSPWPSFHLEAIEFIELLRFSAGFDMSWLRADTHRGGSLRRDLVSTLQNQHLPGSSSPTSHSKNSNHTGKL